MLLRMFISFTDFISTNCSRVLHKTNNTAFRNSIVSQNLIPSSIEHGGTRPFFYMVDQYFGNDSLEPLECIFMAPKCEDVASLALWNACLWLHWPALMRGYQRTLPLYHAFVIDMVLAIGHGIPAPSEAIDVSFSKHQSPLLGEDGDSNAIKRR